MQLKAVLTASNGSWNAAKLCQSFPRHQAMLRGERLHQEGTP
ncbi:MAG: hypothetical protein ACLU8J_06830 [Acutalibacter sp.]